MAFEHFLQDNAQRASLWRLYSRTVGIIQLFYALWFGWMAIAAFSAVVQTEGTFKGVYFPPVSLTRLYDGTMTAVAFFLALIGGSGLLALRPWACRWQIAYLLLICVLAIAEASSEARRGHDVRYIGQCFILLALPYVPFVIVSPSVPSEIHRSAVTAPAGAQTGHIDVNHSESPSSVRARANPET